MIIKLIWLVFIFILMYGLIMAFRSFIVIGKTLGVIPFAVACVMSIWTAVTVILLLFAVCDKYF